MKRGTKPKTPTQKALEGTARPCRDAGKVEVIEPNSLPSQPDWLTPEGALIWLDDVGRVADGFLVGERDSTQFANYCNLQGAIVAAWRAGDCPPIAALTEVRRRAEMFGLGGAKSRVLEGQQPKTKANPFSKL